MSSIAVLFLLYAAAVLLLVAEIFIPSHAVLTVVGVGVLIFAIVKTFDYGQTAGTLSIVGSLIALPTIAVASIKIWPNTPIGRLIAPPNPVLTREQREADMNDIRDLVGEHGTTLSPLRPVGTCEFSGRRLQCTCESGMIDANVRVVAIGIRGRNLEVAVAEPETLA